MTCGSRQKCPVNDNEYYGMAAMCNVSGKEAITVESIPYFFDNYCYLVRDISSGTTLLIDCGDAESVLEYVEKKRYTVNNLLLTHYHDDHTAGTDELINTFPEISVYAPEGEERIDLKATRVADGDIISFGSVSAKVFGMAAHTSFCINYLIGNCLFVSDTLFSAGCGRLFEGTAANLERAMDKIASLSPDTLIYFGHEYTLDNLRFAHMVEPSNEFVIRETERCRMLIKGGEFTTPTRLDRELKINPFLRIDAEEVVSFVDPEDRLSRSERMGVLRRSKDNFQ